MPAASTSPSCKGPRPMGEAWSTTYVIRIAAERCPFCGATDRVKVRTNRNTDGKPEKCCVCKKCSRRYRVLVDDELLPVSG